MASGAENLLLKTMVSLLREPMELTINVLVCRYLKLDTASEAGADELVTGSPFQNRVNEESAYKSAELVVFSPVI